MHSILADILCQVTNHRRLPTCDDILADCHADEPYTCDGGDIHAWIHSRSV